MVKVEKGLEHKLSAEKMYSINFTEHNKEFCLNLHYNRANSYLFVCSFGCFRKRF